MRGPNLRSQGSAHSAFFQLLSPANTLRGNQSRIVFSVQQGQTTCTRQTLPVLWFSRGNVCLSPNCRQTRNRRLWAASRRGRGSCPCPPISVLSQVSSPRAKITASNSDAESYFQMSHCRSGGICTTRDSRRPKAGLSVPNAVGWKA